MFHRHAQDWVAGVFAAVGAVSFWQGVSLTVTILAGLGSLSLIGLRWYVVIKYGPLAHLPPSDD
jgi:hypothetical protein